MRYLVISVLLAFAALPAFAGEVLAKSTLVRGAIITSADIEVETSHGEDKNTVLAKFVGKQVKRTIYAGQKLNPNFVGAPILVRRNSRVTMVYKFGMLEISAFGRALDEGGAGDVISILNLDSRNRVSGVVNEAGIVEVNL